MTIVIVNQANTGYRQRSTLRTMTQACKVLETTEANLDLCADFLRSGGVIGMPTETVYGLAGNALNEPSVRKIFEIKGRPLIDPLIVHFASTDAAENHVEFNDLARELAARFWPGALTMVLPKKATISDLVTAGLPSVAIRVPRHPIFHSLLERLKFPLAAPSANPFGYVSPTLAKHVYRTLGDRILAVLDGGPCEHGVESTIVDLRDSDAPRILRPGPISAEELGFELAQGKASIGAQTAPGMLTQHYSPNTPITLFDHQTQPSNVNTSDAVLYCQKPDIVEQANAFWLSESGDQKEIAHNLFMLIQKLDRMDFGRLHIERAAQEDIGIAINDRLVRAAAKR